MANELITPFLIEQVRAQIAERNSKTFAQFRAPANRELLLNESYAQIGAVK